MRYKKVQIKSVSLTTHPMVCEIMSHDRFKLSQMSDLSEISLQHAQYLLDSHPIPVSLSSSSSSKYHYQLLAPAPLIELLRYHPSYVALMMTLMIYDVNEAEDVLINALFYDAAFTLRLSAHLRSNIHHRYRMAKSASFSPPKKNQLATIANCSTSAFRA